MKSYIVTFKNRFPGAVVKGSDTSVDAYGQDGEHLCSVVKNGAGMWQCNQDASGAKHAFSLSPIPKEARAWKLYKDGKIGKSEEYEERAKHAAKLGEEHGYVPSSEEIAKIEAKKSEEKSAK